MDISGFLSPLITKFLDLILPNENAKELKQKKELGRYLLRTYGIIDAYRQECRRLQVELAEIDEEATQDQLESIACRFRRLAVLTKEFGATIGEISYLRLFDSEMDAKLASGAFLEFGFLWPGTYYSLIVEAETVAQSSLTDQEVKLFPAQPVGLDVDQLPPIVIDLSNKEKRKELICGISEVTEALASAGERLSAFVGQNYKVWELFNCRDELDKRKQQNA